MDIAIIADDSKKELMAQFCIAYAGILSSHHICATHVTGKYISDASRLEIELLMPGFEGGAEQIASRIAYDEVDLLFYFRDSEPKFGFDETESNILRLCDVHNVPLATNLATAEALVLALDKGELDWRQFINPRSQYNLSKKAKEF
ncbi:MAG: methylglyoxal synthase [Clostridia bacterium]|jgi:methylglyoxal synthase|nr:methylglyoxal synthase [Clostridia bacterium]